VKNLTVKGRIDGWFESGGIAGYLEGGGASASDSGSARIENCKSEVDIFCWGGHAGGIAGYVFNGAVIDKCGATGQVRGQNDEIGGVAGTLNPANDRVENSVAFNPSVRATIDNAGRVVGVVYGDGIVNNNYAYSEMTQGDDGVNFTGANGADVDAERAQETNFWAGTMKWSEDIWDFEEGYLPILKDVKDADEQDQKTPGKFDEYTDGEAIDGITSPTAPPGHGAEPETDSGPTVFTANASEAFIPLTELKEAKGDVKIIMSEGEITLNRAAVKSLLEQAEGANNIKVVLTIVNKDELLARGDLPDALRAALLDERVREVYEISLYAVYDDREVEMSPGEDGGELTIRLPYELNPGEDPEDAGAAYLPENGDDPMPMSVWYADGKILFTTNHLSFYATMGGGGNASIGGGNEEIGESGNEEIGGGDETDGESGGGGGGCDAGAAGFALLALAVMFTARKRMR
jgi:hypothetical protein